MNADEPVDLRTLAGAPRQGFPDSPPPAVNVDVEFGAASRTSPLRAVNEDHYLIVRLGRHQETLITSLPDEVVPQRFDEYGYAMVVADGVGGTGTGEAASRLAIATLAHLAIYFGRWNVRIDDQIAREVMDRAERFYRSVDSTLLHRSAGTAALRTTLTASYTAGRDLFLVHVGHSRAYLLHERRLTRLTRDHTLADEPATGTGPLVNIVASARDLHHILTETIGSPDLTGPMIDIEHGQLADGDRLLLCTNGLTDMVGEDRIADVLRFDLTPDEQCAALVDFAVEAGGADDVTAVVAHYRIPDDPTEPAP